MGLHENLDEISRLESNLALKVDEIQSKYSGIAVACSGGIDSTVLFYLLWGLLKRKKNFSLAICHVNFGLRGKESDEDEKFLRDLAARADIEFLGRCVGPEPAKKNVQAWAREQRYAFFEMLGDQGWCIALGHNQDDVAENVLLRLARGTSPIAMAGMSTHHRCFWRPLLGISRAMIQRWADRQHITHREDATNATMKYSRNVVRHEVLPRLEALFPGAATRIARTGIEINRLAEVALGGGVQIEALEASKIATADDLAVFQSVVNLVKSKMGDKLRINHAQLRAACRLIKGGKPQWSLNLGGGARLVCSGGFVAVDEKRVDPNQKPQAQQHKKSLRGDDYQACLGAGDKAELVCQDEIWQLENQGDSLTRVQLKRLK